MTQEDQDRVVATVGIGILAAAGIGWLVLLARHPLTAIVMLLGGGLAAAGTYIYDAATE